MTAWIHNPALILIGAGLVLPLLPRAVRAALLIGAPLAAAAWLWSMPDSLTLSATLFGYELTPFRLDALSFVFALLFLLAMGLIGVFMMRTASPAESAASLIYSGSAVGAVLAGDLVTLFIYWEITAISSALVIFANGPDSYRAGFRYLMIQITSGLMLFVGALIHFRETGSLGFELFGLDAAGGWWLFLGFGIKAAFPIGHIWVKDAYPSASASGTVVLSAFGTKMAIYALARGFAGTDLMIPIGTVMAAFPVFFAVIENDLRRVLAYSTINQLGFMVVGIGVGTELALNGAVAHAFVHVFFKGLLFMTMGAVLLRAGTCKGSELGGLYKSMPWTTAFCIIGAASISAFPLFSGFVSKSLIMSDVAYQGHVFIWLVLLFAAAGVFHHSGIKIPYFAFFAHDSGIRCKEAPAEMMTAMVIAAVVCVGVGIFPQPLYSILPYPVDYVPYTASHVLSQTQLLIFSALAFTVLMRTGIYPPELRSTNLDVDWFFRRAIPDLAAASERVLVTLRGHLDRAFGVCTRMLASPALRERMIHSRPTGAMAWWMGLLFAILLIFGIRQG